MVEVCVRGFFKVPLVRVTRGVWRKGVLEISRKHFKKTCKGIHILVNRSLFADNFMKMCSFVVIFQALHVHFKQFWSFYCTRIINYFCRCKFGLYFHRTPWPCMVCNNRTRLNDNGFWCMVDARKPCYSWPNLPKNQIRVLFMGLKNVSSNAVCFLWKRKTHPLSLTDLRRR